MKITRFLMVFGLLLAVHSVSMAQTQTRTYIVVSTCGAQNYKVGATSLGTIDTDGNVCTNSTGGTVTVTDGALESTQQLVLTALTDVTPVAVNNAAAATGGASVHSVISAANNNSTNIKVTAGTVYHVFATNTSTSLRYIRLYNLSSAPTCSSATGILWRGVIPPASAAGQVGGIAVNFTTVGGAFSTGIGYCITTTVSDTDNNSIGSGEVVLDILWK